MDARMESVFLAVVLFTLIRQVYGGYCRASEEQLLTVDQKTIDLSFFKFDIPVFKRYTKYTCCTEYMGDTCEEISDECRQNAICRGFWCQTEQPQFCKVEEEMSEKFMGSTTRLVWQKCDQPLYVEKCCTGFSGPTCGKKVTTDLLTDIEEESIKQQLIKDEGDEKNIYTFDGKKKFGIGHEIRKEEPEFNMADRTPVSEKRILEAFESDLHIAASDIAKHFGQQAKTWPRQAKEVVTNIMFNSKINGFKQISGLEGSLTRLQWHDAADNIEASEWYKQVKTRGVRLVEVLRNLEVTTDEIYYNLKDYMCCCDGLSSARLKHSDHNTYEGTTTPTSTTMAQSGPGTLPEKEENEEENGEEQEEEQKEEGSADDDDSEFSAWSDWSDCTTTCNRSGVTFDQVRTRSCIKTTGICNGNITETKDTCDVKYQQEGDADYLCTCKGGECKTISSLSQCASGYTASNLCLSNSASSYKCCLPEAKKINCTNDWAKYYACKIQTRIRDGGINLIEKDGKENKYPAPLQNIEDACNGKSASRSYYTDNACLTPGAPGGEICLTATLLKFIYDVSVLVPGISVTSIAGSNHGCKSYHYKGKSVDFSGQDVSSTNRGKVYALYPDARCENMNGICQENSEQCGTEYISRRCYGANTRQCCRWTK